MADYTLGTPLTLTGYAAIHTGIVKVSTNLYAAIWLKDSDKYSQAATYSFSNGVWTQEQTSYPIFTGSARFDATCPVIPCKVDTDRIIFSWCDGVQYLRTRLVDTSASSITDRGSLDVIGAAASYAYVSQIETNKVVVAYRKISDNKLYAVIVTVSGNIQTAGSPVVMSNKTPGSLVVEKIATNKFAILFDNTTDSKATTVIGTVSGTVITPGVEADISGETGITIYQDIISVNDDQYVGLYRDDSSQARAVAITVSGTTPTIGTPVTYEASAPSNIKGVVIDSVSVMYVHCRTSNSGYVGRASIDWSTRIITPGTLYKWEASGIGGLSDRAVGFCFMEINLGAVIYQDQGSSDYAKLISIQSNVVAPVNVAAVPGTNPGEIDISFDSVSGADSYNIYWSNSPGVTKGTGTKITGVTSPHTHSGLTLYQEHFYVVTAVDNGYESDESLEVSAFPYSIEVVAAIDPDDSKNTLTWNDVLLVTSYDIYWGLSTGVTTANGTKIENVTSPYDHIDLSYQKYYYIVVANVGGLPYMSDEVSAIPDFEGKIFNHVDQIKESLPYQYKDET